MSITILDQPTISVVIPYKEVASTQESGTLTNQQALNKIASFLDESTDFLRKRRLAANQ